MGKEYIIHFLLQSETVVITDTDFVNIGDTIFSFVGLGLFIVKLAYIALFKLLALFLLSSSNCTRMN